MQPDHERMLDELRGELRWLTVEAVALLGLAVVLYERGFMRRFGDALRDALTVPDGGDAGEVLPAPSEVAAVMRAARDALRKGA